MQTNRFPARAGRSDGELVFTDAGIEFIAAHARDGDQLGISWDSFQLPWSDVTDVERVLKPRGARPTAGTGGQVRIHYAQASRFATVTLAADLTAFFAAFDHYLARARDAA